ncbi:hypothetical protein [Neobacillus mesonae]|uniref:hypothetical protein n=1 Tax=Neobacillus mesonae TaxID=1193713 RepID=UPI00203E1050|nr:hypothetical protein [Neobacillus mesonae]MCM3569372.1 hypothetical protein [Neobacillus mesonae]
MIQTPFLSNKTFEYRMVAFIIFSMIFAERIVISVGGFQVPIILPITLLGILLLSISNKIRINNLSFGLYLTASVSLLLITLFQDSYSAFSIFYLLILYLPLIFQLESKDSVFFEKILLYLQSCTSIIAFIGIIQLLIQFIGAPYIDLLAFLPEKFVASGYNTTYPIFYGSQIMKTNGMFMLEPSTFSQFLSVAILIEFVYFKRFKYLLLYFSAILISLSGTGLLVVAIFGIFAFLKLGKKKVLGFSTVLIPLAIWFFNTDLGRVILSRTYELTGSSTTNSGYIRFFAPFKALSQYADGSIFAYLFGIGPGKADNLSLDFTANFTPIPKLIIEYGFIGCFIFIIFFLWNIYRNKISLLISTALLFMYLFLGGNLLQPHKIYLIFILLTLVPNKNRFRLKLNKQLVKKKNKKVKIVA